MNGKIKRLSASGSPDKTRHLGIIIELCANSKDTSILSTNTHLQLWWLGLTPTQICRACKYCKSAQEVDHASTPLYRSNIRGMATWTDLPFDYQPAVLPIISLMPLALHLSNASRHKFLAINDQWARFSRPATSWLVYSYVIGAQCRFIIK